MLFLKLWYIFQDVQVPDFQQVITAQPKRNVTNLLTQCERCRKLVKVGATPLAANKFQYFWAL